ncbi:MAG: malate permease [Clostridiales bacterium]|nr:malate permease [Clostridiales bacterium]MDN5299690.1 malate permease [Clostridiales bacterium]
MSVFLFVLINNILPIFVLIGLGFVLSKRFAFDIFTLSKLNFYLFMPAFIFVNLYTTALDWSMFKILIFCAVYLVVNDILARVLGKVRGHDVSMTNAVKNAITFSNTGNIGLSLIILVFSTGSNVIGGDTPFLMTAQTTLIIALVFNNITTNTLGFFNAGRASMSLKGSLKKILSMPSIYAIPLAFILKAMPFDVSTFFIWTALIYMKNSLVATALITLGIQLSRTKIQFGDSDVMLTVLMRLIAGPVIGAALIWAFGFTGVVAQTLLIISALPPAVNTALIAVELENQETFATQVVIMATILSAVTLTFTIYWGQLFFTCV